MSETVTREESSAAAARAGAASTTVVPPSTLEDVDAAMFSAFKRGLKLSTLVDGKRTPVPVQLVSAERWEQVRKGSLFRDENDSLIVPLIALSRTEIVQDSRDDVCGRGINQHTGRLRVSRRLSRRDPALQRLENPPGFSSPSLGSASSPWRSSQPVGRAQRNRDFAAGGAMLPTRSRSSWEVSSIPSPQFVTVKYEVKIWTSYVTQMNDLIEQVYASFLPCDRAFKIVAGSGYWFVAHLDGDAVALESNHDSLGADERVCRAAARFRVPAWILTQRGGGPIARSAIVEPWVEFDVPELEERSIGTVVEPWAGADDPTLPYAVAPRRSDARADGFERIGRSAPDLALRILPRGQKLPLYSRDRRIVAGRVDDRHVRVQRFTRAESQYSGFDLAEFETVVES